MPDLKSGMVNLEIAMHMYRNIWKRILDFSASLASLIVLMPLLTVIAVMLFVVTRKSPLFFQTRIGYLGKRFRVVKFKTMTDDRDSLGRLLPDDCRAFPLGAWLRRCSLDELPQLVNILAGDMSIVGPRPWIPEQMDAFPRRYRDRRCSVRPGLTGMAQVYGRNGIPFYNRLCYDFIYAGRLSWKMDLQIVMQTVHRLVVGGGIHQCADAFRSRSGDMLIHHDPSQPSSPDAGSGKVGEGLAAPVFAESAEPCSS